MTKDKALEMALEFIERVNLNGWMLADLEPEMYSCITAIKDALKTKDKQRTWVGLTDEEIDQGLLRSPYALQSAVAWRDGVAWAMQQLKDKNNV